MRQMEQERTQERTTESFSVVMTPTFKKALQMACEIDGRTPSKVVRALLADFIKGRGIDLVFDENQVREGWKPGRSRPERRKNAAS